MAEEGRRVWGDGCVERRRYIYITRTAPFVVGRLAGSDYSDARLVTPTPTQALPLRFVWMLTKCTTSQM